LQRDAANVARKFKDPKDIWGKKRRQRSDSVETVLESNWAREIMAEKRPVCIHCQVRMEKVKQLKRTYKCPKCGLKLTKPWKKR